MKSLSIALIIDDKFPSSSGVSRSVQTQIEELTRLSHKVTLLAPYDNLEVPRQAKTIPVNSFRLPGLPIHTRILYATNHTAKVISQQHHFNLVHSQTDTGALLLAAKIAHQQHIPHIHTFHTNIAGSHTVPIPTFFASIGFRLYALNVAAIHKRRPQKHAKSKSTALLADESRIGRFDWRTQAIIANAVDASTTPSHYMTNYIHAAASGEVSLSAIIPTGYNRIFEEYARVAQRQRRNKTVRFISISRLVKEKHLDCVIKAFQRAAIPNSELLVVGDGAERKNLIRLAADTPNITFAGHVGDRKQIVQLLRDSDVFVLASYRFDNQPIVIPESLVMGLPVLYCDDRLDVGLHNGTNSLLVQPDEESLAQGMKKLASSTDRKKLSAGTKSVFKELSPEATATAFVKLYQQAITKYSRCK